MSDGKAERSGVSRRMEATMRQGAARSQRGTKCIASDHVFYTRVNGCCQKGLGVFIYFGLVGDGRCGGSKAHQPIRLFFL